jgi:hypothetical protein
MNGGVALPCVLLVVVLLLCAWGVVCAAPCAPAHTLLTCVRARVLPFRRRVCPVFRPLVSPRLGVHVTHLAPNFGPCSCVRVMCDCVGCQPLRAAVTHAPIPSMRAASSPEHFLCGVCVCVCLLVAPVSSGVGSRVLRQQAPGAAPLCRNPILGACGVVQQGERRRVAGVVCALCVRTPAFVCVPRLALPAVCVCVLASTAAVLLCVRDDATTTTASPGSFLVPP